jgi:Superinfection immunity protein
MDNGSMIWLIILVCYFIPTVIASMRGHRQQGAIFVLNLLLGWTLLGWVAALVWAVTAFDKPQVIYVGQQPIAEHRQSDDGDSQPMSRGSGSVFLIVCGVIFIFIVVRSHFLHH